MLNLVVPDDYRVMRRTLIFVTWLLMFAAVATITADFQRDRICNYITSAIAGMGEETHNRVPKMPHIPETKASALTEQAIRADGGIPTISHPINDHVTDTHGIVSRTVRLTGAPVQTPTITIEGIIAKYFWLAGIVIAVPVIAFSLVVFSLGIFAPWVRNTAKFCFAVAFLVGMISVGVNYVDANRASVFGFMEQHSPIEQVVPQQACWAVLFLVAAYSVFWLRRKLTDMRVAEIAYNTANDRIRGGDYMRETCGFLSNEAAFAHARSMVKRKLARFEGFKPFASNFTLEVTGSFRPFFKFIFRLMLLVAAIKGLDWLLS